MNFALGEYYHLYNRGFTKSRIFEDKADYARFLFLILHLQSPLSFENIGRFSSHFVRRGRFNISAEKVAKIVTQQQIRLHAFILMPNHFHLIVEEVSDGGIVKFMKRFGNAYTKYFNARHNRSGYLFQGPCRAVHIGDNEQLLYTSAYIHRNCHELSNWRNKSADYPWSSYQDYASDNRWPKLLATDLIREQFANGSEYREWVETSGAKDSPESVEMLNLPG